MSIAFRCLPKKIRKRRRGLVKWLRKWFNAKIERDLLLPALLQCDCAFLSLFLSTLELIVPPTLRWLKVRHQINSIIIIKTQWQKQITQMVNKPLQRNLNHNRKYRPTAAERNKNSKRAKRPTLRVDIAEAHKSSRFFVQVNILLLKCNWPVNIKLTLFCNLSLI